MIFEMAGASGKIKATYYRVNKGLKIESKMLKIKAMIIKAGL